MLQMQPTTLQLRDAPAVSGLNFRKVRGVEDAPQLWAVQEGRAAHDQLDPLSTLEDVASLEQVQRALTQALDKDELDNWLVTQIDDQVIGYSHILWWQEGHGVWVYLTLGWLLPAWRGLGIGTTMLHWTEDRIRAIAATHPNAGKIELAANASSTEHEATALLRTEGYVAGYTMLELGLDATVVLPDFPFPDGLEVRPVRLEHYRPIAASVKESYRAGLADGRFVELDTIDGVDDYVVFLQEEQQDPTLWQVAWDAEQVAGQVLCVVERGRGEVFEVSVRHAWRRRGLARALLVRAVRTLRERGISTIRLHTNADFKTRALDLYQSVGFRVRKEFPRYRKPFAQIVQVE